jgi:hypothetical protein
MVLFFVGMLFLFTRESFSSVEKKVKDIIVKESNANILIFEYHAQFLPNETRQTENGIFDIVNVENAAFQKNIQSGSPQILERQMMFGLPSYEKPKVEIVATDYEDVTNVNLSPIPFWENGDEMPTPKYEMKSEFYSQNKFFAESIFTIDEPKKYGGISTTTIRIAPYQYNPISKILRKYSRIIVKVEFGKQKFIANGNPVSKNLENSLINFDIAKHWTMNPRVQKSTTRFNSVLASGNWYTIPIQTDGMYKISGATLSANGIPRNSVSTIKIYNNGGRGIPDDPADVSDYGDLIENAILVVDNNSNGNFEDDDYVVFFGKGNKGWNYNSSAKTFSHYIHYYDETNSYFLTYGGAFGKRMSTIPLLTSPSAIVATTVEGKVFREEEKINVQQSGRQWLGELLNSGDEVEQTFSLPGYSAQSTLRYNFSLAGRSSSQSSFSVFEHQNLILTSYINGVNVNNYYGTFCAFGFPSQASVGSGFSEEQSRLKFRYSSSNGGTGYIDWVEIFYQRKLQAHNNVFQFYAADTTAILEYAVSNFSSNAVMGFAVSDFSAVQRITPKQIANGIFEFQTQQNAGTITEFFLCETSGYRAVTQLKRISHQNLHGDTTAIEYVLVTHSEFLEQATRLKNFRQNVAKKNLRSIVVTTEQIYNEFSSGMADVGAIRNYIKYLYETTIATRRPKYVLLFGDGDFDYKRVTASGINFVPPWETMDSFGSPIDSYASDDFFGAFVTPLDVDIAVGRLNVRTKDEAKIVVDKIIEYETNDIRDAWNTRIIFVADDFKQEGTLHNDQADDLAQYYTPNLFDKVKIYSAEFPTVASSLGRRKPTANDAIINEWNKGALIINYTGHGNPRVWTHEQIFTRETTIPLLSNKGKYPFVVAATCNFGQFDNIGTQSSAEVLVNKKESGAIAVFAATRAVYAFSNAVLNVTLYQKMFETGTNGKLKYKRFGDAVYAAKFALKSTTWQDENQNRFFLMGDPALTIGFPQEYGRVDSISISSVTNSNPPLLKALSKPLIHIGVKDSFGVLNSQFSGYGLLSLYDTYRKIIIVDEGPDTSTVVYSYIKKGSLLFNGTVSVQNGISTVRCIIPKDITYDTSMNARIAIYFWNQETDGFGITEFVRVGETEFIAIADNQGPSIVGYFNSPSFRSGDVVNNNPTLIIELSDSNGINTSDIGIGHQLEARIDNEPQSINLSTYYRSEVNDYTRGKITYKFTNIREGEHKLTIRAWDTYNNAADAMIQFRVRTNTKLFLENVYNYPNPFSKETYFTFQHNQSPPLDIEIKIYTISGRQIQSLKSNTNSNNLVKIRWDGRDHDGDEVANGLYLFKIITKTTDNKISAESLGKLSIIR